MKTRVVFDCMIFIQALASDKGPSNACLQLVRDDKIELCMSPEILAEIRDVLGRPKLRKKLPSLTADRVAVFLEDVASLANIVIDVPARFHHERDPKDEPYINLAIFAKARYLESRDRDILDLAEDESFRSQFPELTIIDPVTFLRVVAPVENQPE